jgi:hypothetical protein
MFGGFGGERSASSLKGDTPVPSLRPSMAPTPVALPRKKRLPRVGDIGWSFATTEGDFVAHLGAAATNDIALRANLQFHHIPAELKREYKLEGFYGLQDLPTPDSASLYALPISPAVDRRFHRRNGCGTALGSDLSALTCARDSLVTHRAVNRKAGLSPQARSAMSSPFHRSNLGGRATHLSGRASTISHESGHSTSRL